MSQSHVQYFSLNHKQNFEKITKYSETLFANNKTLLSQVLENILGLHSVVLVGGTGCMYGCGSFKILVSFNLNCLIDYFYTQSMNKPNKANYKLLFILDLKNKHLNNA